MKAEDIKKVACLGAGMIGSSWAVQFALHDLDVALYDAYEAQLPKSRAQIEHSLDALVEAAAITAQRKEEVLSHIRMTTSMEEALQGALFIQENGPERLEIKRSILAQADQYAAPEAIFASSTSGLLISEVAEGSAHPERCIGAHPYNPPHLIPLVELMKGDKTSQETVDLTYQFYQSVGKEAVLLRKECPGFIANRLQLALFREMVDLVNRGVCTVEDVDKAALFGPGIRWGLFGHFMIMQLGNPDGFTGMQKMLGGSGDAWLADMANWQTMPKDMEKFQAGIDEEMKNLPDFKGHDNPSCIAFRDKALIEILKIHHKL